MNVRKLFPIKYVKPLPIEQQIEKCESEINKIKQEIIDAIEGVHRLTTNEFSIWFAKEVIKMYKLPSLEKLSARLNALRLVKYGLNNQNQKQKTISKSCISQEEIETAKMHPIVELARSRLDLKQSGKNFVALCPFHKERTPSFYLYPETNSFYCYGCCKGGDNLTLTMALYGISFKEAVSMLQH